MDINLLKVGDLIVIDPPVGDTVTAYSRFDKTDNIGKLNKGEVYRVHKISLDYYGMIELVVYQTPWPASLHPLSYGGVCVDARHVSIPGAPVPAPVPVDNGKLLNAVVDALDLFVKRMRA